MNQYPDELLDAVRHAWTTDRRAMAVIDVVREHDETIITEERAIDEAKDDYTSRDQLILDRFVRRLRARIEGLS